MRGWLAIGASRPPYPICWWCWPTLSAALCFLLPLPTHAQSFDELIALDRRVEIVAQRLLAGNAPLCRAHAPLTGMILHSRDQYPGGSADPLFTDGPLTIAAVLPDSAAVLAGLQAGDVILAIAGEVPASTDATLREAALALLARQWRPGVPLHLQVRTSGHDRQVTLQPLAGCDVVVEVGTDDAFSARTDGRIIQVGHRLVQDADDDDLAVILAHELSHVILRHRDRLHTAAGGRDTPPRSYRRLAEEEADRLSPYLVANAGLDAGLVPAFWRTALGRRVNHGLLRHRAYPPASERARLTEAAVAALKAAPVPAPADLLAARDGPIAPAD